MRKIHIFMFSIITFFISFISVNASCLDSLEDYASYDNIDPKSKNLTKLASTTEMSVKDYENGNSTTIEVYVELDSNIVYAYAHTGSKYRLLLCTNEETSSTFCSSNEDDDLSCAPVVDKCTYNMAGGHSSASNPAASFYQAINGKVIDSVHEIHHYLGLARQYIGGRWYYGLAFSIGDPDDNNLSVTPNCDSNISYAAVNWRNREVLDQTAKYEGEKKESTYKPIFKSKDVVGVRTKEHYEKNPCKLTGFLKVLKFTRKAINILKVIVPIVIIILGSVDLVKTISSSNDSQLQSSIKSLSLKIVIGLIIFFVPTIVNIIVNHLPKKDNTAFNNCSVCFFGDENNSLNTCNKRIAEISNVQAEINDFVIDWKSIEEECYVKYDKDSNIGNQTAKSEWSKHNPKDKYITRCVCENEQFNGLSKALQDKTLECDTKYPNRNTNQNDQELFDSCIDVYRKSIEDTYIDGCMKDYDYFYKN